MLQQPNAAIDVLCQEIGTLRDTQDDDSIFHCLEGLADAWLGALKEAPDELEALVPPRFAQGRSVTTSNLLFDSAEACCGVLRLPAGSRIAIHDHPGCWGMLFGLYGEFEVRAYDAKPIAHKPTRWTLKRAENDWINSYKHTCFTPTKNNLHSIHTGSHDAFVLSVRTKPTMTVTQSAYVHLDKGLGESEGYMSVRLRELTPLL